MKQHHVTIIITIEEYYNSVINKPFSVATYPLQMVN